MAKQKTQNFLKPELLTKGSNEASSPVLNEAASNLPDSVTAPALIPTDNTVVITQIQKDVVIPNPETQPEGLNNPLYDTENLIGLCGVQGVSEKSEPIDNYKDKKPPQSKEKGPETIRFEKIGNSLRYIDPIFEAIKEAIKTDQKAKLHSINCLQINDGTSLIIFQGNRDNVWAFIEARLDSNNKLLNRNIKIYNAILRQILKSAQATRGIVHLFN